MEIVVVQYTVIETSTARLGFTIQLSRFNYKLPYSPGTCTNLLCHIRANVCPYRMVKGVGIFHKYMEGRGLYLPTINPNLTVH